MGETNRPDVVPRDAWPAARRALLISEKEALRQEDWEEPKGRADTSRGAIPDFS